MLVKSFVLCAFLVLGTKCDIYSDLFNNPTYNNPWSWQEPRIYTETRSLEPETEVVTGKDREPLSPDYKDPIGSGSEQKPVLHPKPHVPKPVVPDVVPGFPGIVDVDASGFGTGLSFGGFDRADFDLSGFGLRPRQPGSGVVGFGGFFGPDLKPWWKGENVCVERSESTDDDDDDDDSDEEPQKNATENENPINLFSTTIRLSNCQETENKYECVTKINNHGVFKTFTVTYKCCYGFKREGSGVGCTKQVDLKPVLETLRDLDNKEFVNLIEGAGLNGKFESDNVTVFAPTDNALADYHDEMTGLNNVDPVRRRRAVKNAYSSKEVVLNHVTPGFVDLTELSNEELIYSENNNSSLRVNIYPTHTYEKMWTVNCARVTKMNNLAKNGIVHLIDATIEPAIQTVEEIIKSHPKLTNLGQVFDKTDIKKHMKLDGHYTVFAPTDDAFNKLDEAQKQKILRGEACAPAIIKHHITAHTVCSSAILGNATTHNVEGDVLNMERTPEDDLIFEGKAKIIEIDIMATNGVIHLIDTVIIPDSALYIGNVLKSNSFSKFEEIIEKAGMTEEINGLVNATVFVPSNEAFEKPETQKLLEEIGDDKEKLREIIKYHTVEGQKQSCDMRNNERLSSNDDGKELRVNLYSTLPLFTNIVNRATVNCARLTGFDEKACGSTVHEVNRLLVPPTKTILEVINSNDKYSTLRKVLKDTEVEDLLERQNTSLTLLAPTDEVFAAMDESDLKSLLEDKTAANNFMKAHVLTEVLCCAGVGPHSWGFNSLVPTLSRNHYEIGRTGSQVRINRAVVTSCDNLATNGVVHTINKALSSSRHPLSTVAGGYFLFDL